ncbi:MAG: hypothetical protein ACPG8W_19490 [Candidatus Promineifilaceae bacterium]
MKNVFRITIGILSFIVVMLVAGPTEAQSNILGNGGFDGPYSDGVATSWKPWNELRNENVDCFQESMYRKPVWSQEIVGGNGGQLWFDGASSQHIGTQFATWHAGVFQNVSVTSGTAYKFTAHGWGRAATTQYPGPSDFGVPFTFRVGIDPTGGESWTSSSIVWGSSVTPHDQWMAASAEAVATESTISVFVAANFAGVGHCRDHLDIWVDGATLVSVGPPPTNTPLPATATNPPPPVTATNTPRPAPPATATPNWNATLTVRAQQQKQPTPNWNATLTVRAQQQQAQQQQAQQQALQTQQAQQAQQTQQAQQAQQQQQQQQAQVQQTQQAQQAQQAQQQAAQTNTGNSGAVLQPVVVVQPVLPTSTPLSEGGTSAVEEEAVDSAEEPTAEPEIVVTEAPPPTEAPSGGTICVNTFADENANGLRDELEGYMAGVSLLIGQNGSPINQGTSTGSDAPICFEGLAPGSYDVAQRLSGSLELTTAGNTVVDVTEGQIISLEFGNRIRQSPENVNEPTLTNSLDEDVVAAANNAANNTANNANETGELDNGGTPSGGLDIIAIVGIVALAAAVILLAGILMVLLRRN